MDRGSPNELCEMTSFIRKDLIIVVVQLFFGGPVIDGEGWGEAGSGEVLAIWSALYELESEVFWEGLHTECSNTQSFACCSAKSASVAFHVKGFARCRARYVFVLFKMVVSRLDDLGVSLAFSPEGISHDPREAALELLSPPPYSTSSPGEG